MVNIMPFYSLLTSFLKNGNGVVVLDWMNIAFLKRKTRIKGFFINLDGTMNITLIAINHEFSLCRELPLFV